MTNLPFEHSESGLANVFTMWSEEFNPEKADSMEINAKIDYPAVQLILPWNVQIVGNWMNEEPIIDCKV